MKSFKTILLLFLLTAGPSALAQNRAQGGIDADMMRQITQQAASHNNAALSNAMASNSIDDLARNYRNSKVHDTHFSVETPAQNIHNQRSSGRCWMYSSFNVMRANFARRHNDTLRVEYSHDLTAPTSPSMTSESSSSSTIQSTMAAPSAELPTSPRNMDSFPSRHNPRPTAPSAPHA